MNTKNRDQIAISADQEAFWAFVVPATATTCTEETSEIVSLCTDLYDAFGKCVRPYGVEFRLTLLAEDRPLPNRGEEVDSIETLEKTLYDESGIDIRSFVDATEVEHTGGRWLPVVDFTHTQVEVHLEDGERYVDRSTDSRLYRNSQPRDEEPPHDVLDVTVSQVPNLDMPEVDAGFLYFVYVRIYSDVIYEDSDVGHANRVKLSSFLGRVDERLPAANIRREPAVNDLEEIY